MANPLHDGAEQLALGLVGYVKAHGAPPKVVKAAREVWGWLGDGKSTAADDPANVDLGGHSVPGADRVPARQPSTGEEVTHSVDPATGEGRPSSVPDFLGRVYAGLPHPAEVTAPAAVLPHPPARETPSTTSTPEAVDPAMEF